MLSPVVSGVETTSGTFAAGGAAAPVTSTANVGNLDSSNLNGATVSLGPTYRSGEDVLSFTNTPNITGNFDSSTGTLTLSGSDSAANYQAALRNVMYQDTSANPTPNIRRFTIGASDTDGTSASVNRYLNSSSLISGVETGSQSYTAGSGTTPLSNTLTVGSTTNGTISGATVKVDANYANGQDVLGFTNTPNITGNFDASTGTLTLSGADTTANYQAALRAVTYADMSSNPTTGVRRLAISANGATDPSFTVNRYVTVGNSSTSSGSGLGVSNVETTSGTFAAGGAAAPVTSTATLGSSGTTLSGATVGLGATYRSGEDVLSFTNTPNITGNFDAATGQLTLSGTDSVANYQAALRNVMYQDTAANPTPNIRRFTIGVSNGADTSTSVNRYLNSTSLISNMETGAQDYASGSGATGISNSLTLGNTTSGMVSGASVKIDANYVNGEDVLGFTNTPNITGNFDAATGTLTLTGSDTVANYQSALRGISYNDAAGSPTTGIRRFAYSVNGATDASFASNRYFNVT